ncbi:DUF2800 domain-containing protein [Ochrobactrum sp. GPK 3]
MAEERAHARLGPSSAKRWLRCPGSVQLIQSLGDIDTGGEAADEGTIFHSIMETCLKEDVDAYDFVGEKMSYGVVTLTITDEHADMLQEGLDRINEIPGTLYVEKRLDLGRWMPGQFGTMDVGIIGKRIGTVWDHKFGFLPVPAVDSDQGRLYGLGFYDRYIRDYYPKIDKMRIIIWQPRSPGGGGEWTISIDELLDFGDWVKKKAKETYGPCPKRVAGLHCEETYCPGAKLLACDTYEKFNLDMIIDDFDEMDEAAELDLPMRPKKVDLISPERRSFIVKNRAVINKFLDRLHASALDDALKGNPVPGLKAVEGRSPPRKWKDEELAEARLLDVVSEAKLFTKKLISPTAAEKLMSEREYAKLKRLVDHGQKKPVLVPAEDERLAVPTIIDELNASEDWD